MTSAQLSSEKLSIAFSVGHSAQLSSTKLTQAQLSSAWCIFRFLNPCFAPDRLDPNHSVDPRNVVNSVANFSGF